MLMGTVHFCLSFTGRVGRLAYVVGTVPMLMFLVMVELAFRAAEAYLPAARAIAPRQ
jgi:hypothetical protein